MARWPPERRLPAEPPTPTPAQLDATLAATAWYLRLYHDTPDDPGVARMFCDPERVGAFAVRPEALAAGEPRALFRLLVATTMFQRRADLQIERVLRGISAQDVEALTDPDALLAAADANPCPRARSLTALLTECDLTKDPQTALGTCAASPGTPCDLKRHTVLLKRYGHFGKVPTSLALTLREHGVADLAALRQRALDEATDPADAAARLESMLRRSWRVSDKIAAMALSMLTNPDLSPGLAPWSEGLDWSGYVVIDSNVDLFLRRVQFAGPWTYAARRAFILALAARIDLSALKPGLRPYNPRLVQQAMYLSQSVLNRKARPRDCAHVEPAPCGVCALDRAGICSLRH